MWICKNCKMQNVNKWSKCCLCSDPKELSFFEKIKLSIMNSRLYKGAKVEQRLIPIYQYLMEELYNNHKIDVIEDLSSHQKRHVMMLFSSLATEQEINQCSCDAEFSRHLISLVSIIDERYKRDLEKLGEVFFDIQKELIEIFWVAQKDIFEYIFSQARNDKIDFENGAKK